MFALAVAASPNFTRTPSARTLAKRLPAFAFAAALALLLSAAPSRAGTDDGEPLTGFHREWVWSTLGDDVGTGGFFLLDLDSDGREELLTAGDVSEYSWEDDARWFTVAYTDGEFRQTWSSLSWPLGLRLVRPALEDGQPRVVAVAPGVFEVFEARTKRSLRSAPIAPLFPTAAAAATLVTGGPPQLLVCDSSDLRLYELASGTESAAKFGFGCTDLAVGQLDADPELEVVLAGNSFGTFVLDGESLQVDWALPTIVGSRVRLADLDSDGFDDMVLDLDPIGNGLAAYRIGSSAPLWSLPSAYVGAFAIEDVQGDATPEVIWGGRSNGTIQVLAGDSGLPLWSVADLDADIGAVAAGDPDEDGDPEIVWTQRDVPSEVKYRLVAASVGSHSIEGTSLDLGGPLTGLGAGDVDADGNWELATASSTSGLGYSPDGGKVLVFDAASRQLEYVGPTTPPGYNGGAIDRMLLLQADSDSPLEICTAFEDYSGDAALHCEDGGSHALEWGVTFPPGTFPLSLLPAELDLDVFPELIVGSYWGDAFAFEAESGWLKYRTPFIEDQPGLAFLRAGDAAGGTDPELVAGALYYDTGVVVFEARTGSLLYGPWWAPVTSFELAQMDADPQLEIVAGTIQGEVAILDPETGQLGPPIASFGQEPITAVRVADVTRDGVADLVVVTGGRLVVRDGSLGAIAWTSPMLGSSAGQRDGLWVANLDTDALPEMAVLTAAGFVIFEPPLFLLFTDGFESGDLSNWSSHAP